MRFEELERLIVNNFSYLQVIKSLRKDDIPRARKQSYLAKKLATLAIIFGIAILTLVIVIYFIVKFKIDHS